jgi:hypothetical protein
MLNPMLTRLRVRQRFDRGAARPPPVFRIPVELAFQVRTRRKHACRIQLVEGERRGRAKPSSVRLRRY